MTTRNCWVPVGTRLPPRLASDFVSSYFTQDADSEGSEGKFFVWTADEIREVLGSDSEQKASFWLEIGMERPPYRAGGRA